VARRGGGGDRDARCACHRDRRRADGARLADLRSGGGAAPPRGVFLPAMSFAEDVARHDLEQRLTRVEQQAADYRRERDLLRQAVKARDAELAELRARLGILEAVDALNPRPPRWTVRSGRAVRHHAILASVRSETHWDEVGRAEEV